MKKPLPFPPPRPSSVFDASCGRMSDILNMLPERAEVSGREQALAAWLRPQDIDSIWEKTEDPFSRFFKGETRDLSVFRSRVQSESVVAELLREDAAGLNIQSIERICALGAAQRPQGVRTTRLITAPNSRGRRVEFALPEDVPLILQNVLSVWERGIEGEGDVYAALWIMVGILNAHPFMDGNGRLARAMMNAYLIKTGVLKHGPLPLGALIYAAAGNYVVAVRRVVIDGNWEQLGKVMAGLLDVYVGVVGEFEREHSKY